MTNTGSVDVEHYHINVLFMIADGNTFFKNLDYATYYYPYVSEPNRLIIDFVAQCLLRFVVTTFLFLSPNALSAFMLIPRVFRAI